MDGKSILKYGAVALGGWWLYSNWQTITGAHASAAAAPAPAAPAPAAAAPAPAPAAAPALDAVTLVQKLKAAAGVTSLNRDQWNYYRNTIAPPELTGAQFAQAFPNADDGRPNMSAEDFVLALHNVGLAGYRPRTMHRARRLNYRRARA
jgi:hypothetical protein